MRQLNISLFLRLICLFVLLINEFMEKYGHLRPGTYEIRSPRYDALLNFNFGIAKHNTKNQDKKEFIFSKLKLKKIDKMLKNHGFLEINSLDLISYIKDAISKRELAKFVFTRSLSDLIEIIASIGERYGLSRDELSHIPINYFLNMFKQSSNELVEVSLRKISQEKSRLHQIHKAIKLPQIISTDSSLRIIPFQVSHPNFITNKRVVAETLFLSIDFLPSNDVRNKIVMIEGADPGYDWIFTYNIKGLITKYGGVNSHMAIRCAEFLIPAAIGCGEQRFEELIKANQILLDCATRIVIEA